MIQSFPDRAVQIDDIFGQRIRQLYPASSLRYQLNTQAADLDARGVLCKEDGVDPSPPPPMPPEHDYRRDLRPNQLAARARVRAQKLTVSESNLRAACYDRRLTAMFSGHDFSLPEPDTPQPEQPNPVLHHPSPPVPTPPQLPQLESPVVELEEVDRVERERAIRSSWLGRVADSIAVSMAAGAPIASAATVDSEGEAEQPRLG